MPFKAQDRVVRIHAAAVVNDLDKGASGICDNDLDIRCTGVYGIFHEFFYHGGGPLDHFPRSNHVGDIFGQYSQFFCHSDVILSEAKNLYRISKNLVM